MRRTTAFDRDLMTRVVLAWFLALFVTAASAQAPSPASPAPPAPAKAVAKKKAPAKPKPAAQQPVAAASGPCSLGVISAVGDRFSVQKFGLTIFANEKTFVPIDNWGLDDLVIARVHATTGNDPTVHGIAYPKGAFEPYFNPKSNLLRAENERLPTIVRGIAANARCERYLVVLRSIDVVPGTKMEVDGIGAWNQGIGSALRHSHLFAAFSVTMLDGQTYERINRPFSDLGARLAQNMRIIEDPLNRLDNEQFPDPPSAATGNAVLRERTRQLLATRLDQALSVYLKRD
jgi:hypothetical protein